jgi:hypothetical protein
MLCLERSIKTAKSLSKDLNESDAGSEGLPNKGEIKQWKKLHGLQLELPSPMEAVLDFCATIAWLHVGVLLVYARILLLVGSE